MLVHVLLYNVGKEEEGIHSIDLSIKKINLEGFLTKKTPITIGSSILCSGICLTVKQIN